MFNGIDVQEFNLQATHELFRNGDDYSHIIGEFAIRKSDHTPVLLQVMDLELLSQSQRMVVKSRIKAHVQLSSTHLMKIYSMEKNRNGSKLLIEFSLDTKMTLHHLLASKSVTLTVVIKIFAELTYAVAELLEYYVEHGVSPTRGLLEASVLLPDTIFILDNSQIILLNPCIVSIEVELGLFKVRPLWKRYAAPEFDSNFSSADGCLDHYALEKVMIWSIGVIISDFCAVLDPHSTSGEGAFQGTQAEDVQHTAPEESLISRLQLLLDLCLVADASMRISCDELRASIDHMYDEMLRYSDMQDDEGFYILPREHILHTNYSVELQGSLDMSEAYRESDLSVFGIDNRRSKSLISRYFSRKNELGEFKSRCYFSSESNVCRLSRNEYERYMDAAANGRVDIVALLINRCCKYQDSGGTTALMAAIKENQPNCVAFLAKYEAGVQDKCGFSALMYAVMKNDAKSIKLLRETECRLIDNEGMTALMHAVEYNHHQLIHQLIEELDIKDIRCRTAYSIAKKLNHSACIEVLESLHPQLKIVHINRVNSHGYTTLMLAAIRNDVVMVEQLSPVEAGAIADDGCTALHAAILHNNYLCLPPLLRYERSIMTKVGLTPLKLAEKLNHPECVRILKGPPVEVYLPNKDRTLLMMYAESGDIDLLKTNINDVRFMTCDGKTALMIAAAAGNYYCIKELLMYEQEIVSPNGWTALMYASFGGHADCVALLAESESGHLTTSGQTAYDIALEHGHKKCARLLAGREKHLTTAFQLSMHLSLDNMEGAIQLLRQPFVPSQALIDCIWSIGGDDFVILWSLVRERSDLNRLCTYITLDRCIDLNDSDLTKLVLINRKPRVSTINERDELEILLNHALFFKKALVIPTICKYATVKRLRLFIKKRIGRTIGTKTPLMEAAEAGDASKVEQHLNMLCYQHSTLYIFQEQGRSGKIRTVSNVSALMLAVINRHINCIPLLSPEMGLRDHTMGITALILAIWQGSEEAVRLLLPEAKISDKANKSPLMHALKGGNRQCTNIVKAYLRS